jgi:small subunit ribosomal protein S21
MKDNHKKYGKKPFKKASKGGETLATVPDQFAHIEPVQAQPLEVKVYGNNFDKALRAFRALVQKERILSSYKEKQSYEKPSDKRRRKRNEMKRKLLELESNKGEKREPKQSNKKRYSSE